MEVYQACWPLSMNETGSYVLLLSVDWGLAKSKQCSNATTIIEKHSIKLDQ